MKKLLLLTLISSLSYASDQGGKLPEDFKFESSHVSAKSLQRISIMNQLQRYEHEQGISADKKFLTVDEMKTIQALVKLQQDDKK
jgi:hypothetical protein